MADIKFTETQLSAIDSRGVDLLISASAGTGKTAVLIERIIKLIINDGVDISHILVVTYTEKAAKELKSKLSARLTGYLTDDMRLAKRLEEQIEKIEFSDISTIHSFCKKIAVQNFNLSGIDPSSRVIDEEEKNILMRDCINSIIREELSAEEQEVAFYTYIDARNSKDLRNLLLSLYSKAGSFAEPVSFFEKALKVSEGSDLASSLLRLAIRFSKKYAEAKLKRGLMDFDDMQYFALEALKNDELRQSYKEYYDYIFVDEYQDTSFIQDEIIELIAKPGSRFIVGDYKQSIYGFRNARPELFFNKYREYSTSEHALCISLNENFRSEKQVIDAVNQVFSEIMTADFGGISYKDEAALKYSSGEIAVGAVPEDRRNRLNFIVKPKDDGEEDYETDEYAYLCLINRIKELKEKCGYAYKDICVLMRSPNSKADKINRLFENSGVAITMDTEDELFYYPEINTLMDFIRAVDNPYNDVAMLAIMRSPIGRFTDDELFTISNFRRDKNVVYYADVIRLIRSGLSLNEDIDEKLLSLDDRIHKFRDEANLTLRERMIRVIEESDYRHYLLGRKGGEALMRGLYEFLEYLYDYDVSEGSNLHSFISRYDEAGLSGTKNMIKSGVKPGYDSVRLMSIHKSKGLQFDVVLLFDAGKDFFKKPASLEFNKYAFGENFELHLNYIDRDRSYIVQNPAIEAAKSAQLEKERLEEQRLFYVAMTRAKKKLEIFVKGDEKTLKNRIALIKNYEGSEADADEVAAGKKSSKKKTGAAQERVDYKNASSYYDWLIYALDMKPIYDYDFSRVDRTEFFNGDWEFCVLSPYNNSSEAAAEEAALISKDEGVAERAYVFKELIYPYKKLHRRTAVTGLKRAEPDRSLFVSEKSSSHGGAARGTLYHRFMEKFVGNYKTLDDFLAASDKYFTPKELDELDMDKIRAFEEHGIFERIRGAKKVWKEKSFIYRSSIDGEDLQIQGIIDLAFLEKSKLVILDYKSDRLKNAYDFVSRYKTQLDLYAEALEEITGVEVSEKLIYSFELGGIIEV